MLHFIDRRRHRWRSRLERYIPAETQQHTEPVRLAGHDETHGADGNRGHAYYDSPSEEFSREIGRAHV